MRDNGRARILPAVVWPLLASALLFLAGCGNQSLAPREKAEPAVAPLQQYMLEAEQVATGGSEDKARDLYRAAAKAYPTSKEPWLKLASNYFASKNYGQAILASQEVLQRDPNDSVATSMLAVSGLRVSVSAMSLLRQQHRPLAGDTRTEAEDLAAVLRDELGEPVLVPPLASEVKVAPSKRRLGQRRPSPPRAAGATPGSPSAAPASDRASQAKPALPGSDSNATNPFDTLKK